VDEDLLWEILQSGDPEFIEILFGAPMTVVSSALRGLLMADEGHDLIGCDYASIEARVLAWLAGEERALDIFRTHGKVYEDFASQIFGVALEEVTKEQRAHGKVGVLGCGYQMGWKTLQRYAEGYGMNLTDEEAQRIVNGFRNLHPNITRFWPTSTTLPSKRWLTPARSLWQGGSPSGWRGGS
jgi:DNA polymerase